MRGGNNIRLGGAVIIYSGSRDLGQIKPGAVLGERLNSVNVEVEMAGSRCIAASHSTSVSITPRSVFYDLHFQADSSPNPAACGCNALEGSA